MSCLYIEAPKGGKTSSPFIRMCLSPWTSDTGLPSDNTHQTLIGGEPEALHTITAPDVLEKCTLDGGSTEKRGPDPKLLSVDLQLPNDTWIQWFRTKILIYCSFTIKHKIQLNRILLIKVLMRFKKFCIHSNELIVVFVLIKTILSDIALN